MSGVRRAVITFLGNTLLPIPAVTHSTVVGAERIVYLTTTHYISHYYYYYSLYLTSTTTSGRGASEPRPIDSCLSVALARQLQRIYHHAKVEADLGPVEAANNDGTLRRWLASRTHGPAANVPSGVSIS